MSMKWMVQVVIVALSLSLAFGCAKTKAVPVGGSPESLPWVSGDVTFFSNEGEVHKPFTVVGSIYYMDPGEYKRMKFIDVVPILKEKAKTLGANGIIIDIREPVVSGWYERGIEVSGRAIKY
jgi:hypothetical protein